MRSTISQRRPRALRSRALLAAALLLLGTRLTAAQPAAPPLPPADDPFARGSWHLELGGHGALETWNYNISHEEMVSSYAGLTYGLGRGVVFRIGSPLYYVDQRGPNAYLLGVTWGVRARAIRRKAWSLFWEFEVGISDADTYVPPGGTRFNYLALGGGGVSVRLRSGIHGVAGLRWVHVSNNGLAGRSRNPDIEAVGPAVGVLLAF